MSLTYCQRLAIRSMSGGVESRHAARSTDEPLAPALRRADRYATSRSGLCGFVRDRRQILGNPAHPKATEAGVAPGPLTLQRALQLIRAKPTRSSAVWWPALTHGGSSLLNPLPGYDAGDDSLPAEDCRLFSSADGAIREDAHRIDKAAVGSSATHSCDAGSPARVVPISGPSEGDATK